MRIACWLPKATNTNAGCVILIAYLLQQWVHECALVIRCTVRALPFLTVVPSIFNQVKDVRQMLKGVVSSFYCAQ
jgi:hypothetical protein